MKIDIKDKDKKRFNLKKDFSMIEFDVVNPTSSPFVINLFDTTTLTSVPTSPTGSFPSNVLSVIPSATFLQLIAYCPINNFVYVCAPALGRVGIIDCATDTVIGSIITGGVSPSGITYNPTNNCMYVTNNGSNNVVQISCSTNTVINTDNTGASPYGVAYDSVNNRIYIANTVGGSISVLDCATSIIIATIILPLSTPLNLSYNTNNGTIYVTSQLFSNVFVIDCATNTLVGLPIPVGVNPTGIDYNPLSNTMYVCNIGSNTISVIDCATATVVATINTIISGGASPLSITYYPLNNLMYVGFIGNVLILDCNTNTFLPNNIFTGVNNYGIAYNFIKNSMYVSANTIGVFDINSPLLPYITSSFNYNEFIQDIIYNPVWVERIVFYSQSSTTFNQVINNTSKDANGNLMNNPYIPSMSVGTSQFQSGIGKLDFPNAELVLGVNQYLANFTVAPNSDIKLILIYKQLQKIELLTDKEKMCNRIITTRNPIQPVMEKDNKVAVSKYIAFDFIPFVDLVEKEITPFNISSLSKSMFKGTKPMEGAELKSLHKAMKKQRNNNEL